MKTKQNTNSSSMKTFFWMLLLFSGIVEAQIVNIPDANFKAKLLAASPTNTIAYGNGAYAKIDTNDDGEIQETEAQSIDSLNVSASQITNITGISSFVNLKKLDCSSNHNTVLDVHSISNLQFLNCSGNSITNLNVSGLSNLVTLNCSSNQFTNISLSGLTSLETLFCGENHLSSLDMTGLTNLTNLSIMSNNFSSINLTDVINLQSFDCEANHFQSLDLSSLTNLRGFGCVNNQITSLNISGLTNLQDIYCGFNLLTTLDLSEFTNLKNVSCISNPIVTLDLRNLHHLESLDCRISPNLTSLFIKNGANENVLFNASPNLQFICADEFQTVAIQQELNLEGMTNTVLNSYCTFTPGGTYNTITGHIKYDADNNGCDSNDNTFPFTRININDGNAAAASFTNSSGIYTFYTQAGSFDITPSTENPTWFNFSPAIATIPFADNNNNTANQNFCITANGIHPDIEVTISPLTPARPGFGAAYKIVYRNKGNQTVSGNITFTYADATLDYVGAMPTPDAQDVGLLNWNYSNLLPFESRSIDVVLNVNTPTDSPSVNVGDVLNFEATITPVIADEFPNDNVFAYHQTVVGSLDPNTIECLEGAVVAPTEIGDYLHYAINFENTGTYPAENIVVKTEIDPAKFDISTLQFLNASNPVQTRITGNVVEFIFENINLGIGGHGHILLKLKTNPNLVTGDSVSKRADIFFDYNFPVDTGLANTVFQTLSNAAFETDASVAVFPNPTTDFLNVSANSDLKSIELFDVQGRILQMLLPNTKETKVTMTSLPRGIYFVRATTAKGVTVQKIQKK